MDKTKTALQFVGQMNHKARLVAVARDAVIARAREATEAYRGGSDDVWGRLNGLGVALREMDRMAALPLDQLGQEDPDA